MNPETTEALRRAVVLLRQFDAALEARRLEEAFASLAARNAQLTEALCEAKEEREFLYNA